MFSLWWSKQNCCMWGLITQWYVQEYIDRSWRNQLFDLHNIISCSTLTPTSSTNAFESTQHDLVDEWCWCQDQASHKTIVLQESNPMNTHNEGYC